MRNPVLLLPLLLLLIFYSPSALTIATAGIPITKYGTKGDGITDDTVLVQKALSYCSDNGITCTVPANRRFLIREPLFLWGGSDSI